MAQLSSAETASPQVAADRWTAYSVTVWAICMLGFAFDIYEATIMQLVTPLLIKEWGIAPATIGNITTVSRWVGLIGIFLFPTLADFVRPQAHPRSDDPRLFAVHRSHRLCARAAAAADLHLDHPHHAARRNSGRHDHGQRDRTDEMACHRAWRSRRRLPVRLHVVLSDGSRSRAAVGMAVSLLARNPAGSAGFRGPAGYQGEPTFRACH